MSDFSVSRLACRRGGRMLFEDLSFALSDGDAAVVTGPNGIGKSSLLRIAGGLLAPAAGSVVRPAAGAIAYLAETTALDADRTLERALRFWATLDRRGATDARIAAALDDVALGDLAGVPVRMLSTGQRRRAGIARVLVSATRLWLLDEPANGLDNAAVVRLESLVARHRASGGMVLIATHLAFELPDALPVTLGVA